jgi:hypothetical protein
MIDFLGVVIGAVVWLGLSLVLGAGFALAAWLLLRKRRGAILGIIAAGLLPPACATYVYVCEVVFPDTSLFGDINEPLPHGYTLKALGKMPEYGEVESVSSGYSGVSSNLEQLEGWVGEVDLEGDMLFGKYSHGFDGSVDKPKWCCFVLNTVSGQVRNFATGEEMNAFAGKKITTEEVQFFHSREPARRRQERIENWIQLTPPTMGALLLIALLVKLRLRPKSL